MAGQVLAPNFHRLGPYPCDGSQHTNSFVLDYNSTSYIRHVEIAVLGAVAGQSGTITLSQDTTEQGSQFLIASCSGQETSSRTDYGENAVQIPAAQALAFEWSGSGGGNRSFNATIYYTGSF